ncbi:MAG TPA: phosphatase [Firmicutes bacterium]|nr:phosphatase [Bacillota bacterium]
MHLTADLHIHTVSSGHAYSTVLEIAGAARDKGLEMVAITDHGPAMPGGPHPYYFGNLRAIPREICGVRILRGAELNVIDREGNLDLSLDRVCQLDIVLAGLHEYCFPDGSVEENTRGMIAAMRNPFVDIVVHPGNPEFKIDPAKIVRAATELGIAIEVNNSSLTTCRFGSATRCREIMTLAKQYGTLLSVGSDSHIALTVGELSAARELLKTAGVPAEQVLNTSGARTEQYLAQRRAKRPPQR